RGFDELLGLLHVADIRLHGDSLTALVADRLYHFLGGGGAAVVVHHNPRPAPGQFFGNRPANPARCSRYDGHTLVTAAHLHTLPSLCSGWNERDSTIAMRLLQTSLTFVTLQACVNHMRGQS